MKIRIICAAQNRGRRFFEHILPAWNCNLSVEDGVEKGGDAILKAGDRLPTVGGGEVWRLRFEAGAAAAHDEHHGLDVHIFRIGEDEIPLIVYIFVVFPKEGFFVSATCQCHQSEATPQLRRAPPAKAPA